MRSLCHLCASLVACAAPALAQDAIDPASMTEIERIRAIDNHMHADVVAPARPLRRKFGNPLCASRYPDVAVSLYRPGSGAK